MKKIVYFLMLLVCTFSYAQTSTPNIGLQIPATGSNNWYIPLNYNFSKLDQLLSGNLPLPALSVTNDVHIGGNLYANQFIGPSGSSFATATGAQQYSPVYYCGAGTSSAFCGVSPFTGIAKFNTNNIPQAAAISDILALWVGGGCGTTTNFLQAGGTCTGSVTSINGTAGAFTFSGAGVTCTATSCIFSGGSGGGVSSFNTRTGTVTLNASDVNSVGTISNSTTGNSATTTSLASTPANCGALSSATGIQANGNPSACITSLLINLPETSNLLADYQLSDGSGTAPIDSSGKGNTGSFPGGAANPTWTSQGLAVDGTTNATGQYFNTVGTQNAKTIMMVYTITAPLHNNGPQNPSFYTLFSTSALTGLVMNSDSQQYGYQSGLHKNGSAISQMDGTTVGTHVLIVVLGTGSGNNDIYYLDGLNITLTQAASFGNANSDYSVGGANTSFDTYMTGNIYRWTAWSTQLTPSEVLLATGNAVALAQSRGVIFSNLQPVQAPVTNIPQLVCTGDSLTNGQGVVPYCTQSTSYINTNLPYNVNNYGIGNIGAINNLYLARYREQLTYAPNAQSNINYIWDGTNDVSTRGRTPLQAFTAIAGQCSIARSFGFKTIISTMISRISNDANKNTLNGLIRSQGLAYCDAISDVAANPNIGADGAYANTTYFQGDGVHLTTTGQEFQVAPIASNVINSITGSTPSKCDPNIVTTATYTSVAADGCKVFNASANNIVDTLPSAMGYTGRIISRCNQTSSGTDTVTIAAPSDFDFNNDGTTTSVVVTNNTCRQFRSTLVSPTTGGEYWQIVN